MAFPSVIVECAFDSVLSEQAYAQTGYTEITKYVESISGTLRGRSYELDDIETGSITLKLDNADGRFTPGSPLSPYYPYVKANRRLRIRGTNLQRLNIARAGGQDLNTDGFFLDSNFTKDASDGTTVRVTEPVLVKHNPTALGYTGELLKEPYHVEGTLKAGAAAGAYRIISYYCPIELGVRSTHSAYVWKVSGTEPNGTLVYLVNAYFDADGNEIEKAAGRSNYEWTSPSPTMPTRRVFCDLPPGDAAYMIQSVAVITTSTTTTDITYAVNGIQSEIPSNLVPSISGYYDLEAWQINATGDVDPGTLETNVDGNPLDIVSALWTMGTESVELYTVIPHLVPGDYYTFVVEAARAFGGPDILISADDGQSGSLLTTGSWQTHRVTFQAMRAEQAIKFIPQGTVVADAKMWLRRARCSAADENLPLAVDALDTDVTDWQRPIPIFDGWVERWPIRTTASSSDVTIIVNDRCKKLGDVLMDSTLKQTLISDDADLILPLDDHPGDSQGRVSIAGDWSEEADLSQLVPSTTKYGPGAAKFALGGLIGPTEDDAVKLTQVSANQGYVLLLPYTADYTTTPAAPIIKPPPVPKPLAKSYYRKTYRATWTQSYQGTNARRTSPYLYQGVSGFVTENYGNQKSLIGFNWQAIKADLKPYKVTNKKTKEVTTMNITPVAVTVTMFAVDWGLYTSGTGYIGWHKYGTAPGTYDSVNVAERLVKVSKWPRNAWRTITLPAGTAKGFQTGNVRGVSVGHGDGNKETYGTFYGATAGAFRPYITITYKVTPVKKKK